MTKRLKADISLLFVTIVWGTSFALMKQAIDYIPPFTFLAYRYFLAALILFVVFNKSIIITDIRILKYGFLIGIVMFAGCALQIVGLQFTSASKSGFVTGLNVVLVPLFLAFYHKKLPPASTLLSILIAVIGLAMITIDSTFKINIGDILTFLCAVFFALQVIFISKYSPGLDPIGLTCVALITVSLFSFIPGIFYERLHAVLNASSIFAVVFTAVFCSSLAYSVQMAMQKYTSPTHAALIFMGEPVFSMLFAFIFLGETLTLKGAAGCALVFAGMILSEFKFKRPDFS